MREAACSALTAARLGCRFTMRRLLALLLALGITACTTPRATRNTGLGLMLASGGASGLAIGIGAGGRVEEPATYLVPLVASGLLFSVGAWMFYTGWADMEREREIEGVPERKRSAFDED